MSKDCWGCGQDYRNRWREEDMVVNVTLNDTPAGERIDVCPDCYEELCQEERVNTY